MKVIEIKKKLNKAIYDGCIVSLKNASVKGR